MILTVKILSQYDKVKPVYFSIDHVWRHSTNVARTARVMALLETNDTNCSSTAYTGGLMHDLGKVILAANFDDQYHTAHTMCAQAAGCRYGRRRKAMFGATHGEIGSLPSGPRGALSAEVVRRWLHCTHHRSDADLSRR